MKSEGHWKILLLTSLQTTTSFFQAHVYHGCLDHDVIPCLLGNNSLLSGYLPFPREWPLKFKNKHPLATSLPEQISAKCWGKLLSFFFFFYRYSTRVFRSIRINITEFTTISLITNYQEETLHCSKLQGLHNLFSTKRISWILINCDFYRIQWNSNLALNLKMLVLVTAISVPHLVLVSKSAHFAWNF